MDRLAAVMISSSCGPLAVAAGGGCVPLTKLTAVSRAALQSGGTRGRRSAALLGQSVGLPSGSFSPPWNWSWIQ